MRLNINLERLRGQCYDGVSAISEKRGGVAMRISDIEPRETICIVKDTL